MTMHKRILLALALLANCGLAGIHAAPVAYTLPDETAAFKPGSNLDTVQTIAPPVTPPITSRRSRAAKNSKRTFGRRT
jgi:hypothetical protein